MQGPTGKIVLAWRVAGIRYRIEKLVEPIRKGAGVRTHRLWRNNEPCSGGQWHYDVKGAIWRADYEMRCRYGDRIRRLEHRVAELSAGLVARGGSVGPDGRESPSTVDPQETR